MSLGKRIKCAVSVHGDTGLGNCIIHPVKHFRSFKGYGSHGDELMSLGDLLELQRLGIALANEDYH